MKATYFAWGLLVALCACKPADNGAAGTASGNASNTAAAAEAGSAAARVAPGGDILQGHKDALDKAKATAGQINQEGDATKKAVEDATR